MVACYLAAGDDIGGAGERDVIHGFARTGATLAVTAEPVSRPVAEARLDCPKPAGSCRCEWTGRLRAATLGAMRAVVVFVLLVGLLRPVLAQDEPREVDVELYLAVDVSRSMAPAELEIQRQGYAAALRSDEVIGAIASGLIGEVALTYVEWSGDYAQRVVIPWTAIDTRDAAVAFAERIESNGRTAMWRTSISGALRNAQDSIETNRFLGLRRVVDISGDGPNNQGGPVTEARDAVVAAGITINGLPLMTRDGIGTNWHLEDLDDYYRYCVIGGPGAFTIPVRDWSAFALAVKRKLVLEIAGLMPEPPERIVPAQYYGMTEGGYDCMIGERIWRENRGRFTLP